MIFDAADEEPHITEEEYGVKVTKTLKDVYRLAWEHQRKAALNNKSY